jgi:hypothetical protein
MGAIQLTRNTRLSRVQEETQTWWPLGSRRTVVPAFIAVQFMLSGRSTRVSRQDTKWSLYWEAGSHSAAQEIPRPVSIYSIALLGSILSHFSPVYTLTPCFFKLRLSIVLSSTHRSARWSLLFGVSFWNICTHFSSPRCPAHLILLIMFC